MNIGEQIRSYRKEKGLTQEQVATILGVTAPAVNKWERAVSMPDITLLPALARLLEIDMNTLFAFHEELTDEEIAAFVNELYAKAIGNDAAGAFAAADTKIRDYPHCHRLIYTAATMLHAALTLSTLPANEKSSYTEKIIAWFDRSAESEDDALRLASRWQLATLALSSGDLDRAEQLIDQLPDTDTDRNLLIIRLLAAREAYDEAALMSESQVLAKVIALHTQLMQLIEFEVKAGHDDEAAAIAQLTEQLITLFGLWPHEAASPHLVLALMQKDRTAALHAINTVFSALQTPWNGGSSLPQFYRLAAADRLPDITTTFTTAFIREMQTQSEYDFLRNDPAFQALLSNMVNTWQLPSLAVDK